MEKMVGDGVKQDKIMDEIQTYQDEEGTFGRESAKRQRRNKSFDPGEYLLSSVLTSQLSNGFLTELTLVFFLCNEAKWWSIHGTSAPNLRVLAMQILSLTCSSSPCERNFSVFQQVNLLFLAYDQRLNCVCMFLANYDQQSK